MFIQVVTAAQVTCKTCAGKPHLNCCNYTIDVVKGKHDYMIDIIAYNTNGGRRSLPDVATNTEITYSKYLHPMILTVCTYTSILTPCILCRFVFDLWFNKSVIS